MSARGDQALSSQVFLFACISGEQGHAVSQYLLRDRAADTNGLIFSASAIERKNATRFKRTFICKQDCATLSRDHLEEQLEQSFQQIIEPTDRVNDGADFHECAQVAGHLVERVVETNLHRGAIDYLRFVKRDVTRFRSRLAIVSEKDKMYIADANPVAMLEHSILDRNIVDERPVETFKIGDQKPGFVLFYSGMTTRNRRIGGTEVGSGIATDDKLFIVDREDCSLELPGNCCETRRHYRILSLRNLFTQET